MPAAIKELGGTGRTHDPTCREGSFSPDRFEQPVVRCRYTKAAALTTPLVDMLELFRRWRVPVILVDIMVVVYRFIFVLLESLDRMYMAQDSRLGYNTSYLRAMNSAALLGSRLFIEAFQRSRRLQIALEARGYDGGDLQVLPSSYRSDRKIMWAGIAVAASMVAVWIMV